MADLLDAMRDHLVTDGAVRVPRDGGSAPPLWLEPRDGAPAPGDKTGAEDGPVVLSAFLTGGIASRPYESFMRTDIVDVWLRALRAQDVWPVENALRASLVDKRGWTMGGLTVIESLQWRPLQRFGSDAQGFTYITAFSFQFFASA